MSSSHLARFGSSFFAAAAALFLGACAAQDAKRPEAVAPCGPNDCTRCDETKQKCMGPMMCDGHPERASRQCVRDTSGQCKDTIVCAP